MPAGFEEANVLLTGRRTLAIFGADRAKVISER